MTAVTNNLDETLALMMKLTRDDLGRRSRVPAAPKGHFLGRCTNDLCGEAYAVAGLGATLEMVKCPLCGSSLTQTTKMLRRGFIALDGRRGDSDFVETMLELGLADAIAGRIKSAQRHVAHYDALRAKVEAGEYELRGEYVYTGSGGTNPGGLIRMAEKDLAKARQMRRKLRKLSPALRGLRVVGGTYVHPETEVPEVPELDYTPIDFESNPPAPAIPVGTRVTILDAPDGYGDRMIGATGTVENYRAGEVTVRVDGGGPGIAGLTWRPRRMVRALG